MAVELSRRKTGSKQIRDRQRLAHLLAGVLLIVYVYMPPQPGSWFEAGIRWIVLPLVVVDGVLMWQWPKVRRLARRLGSRR